MHQSLDERFGHVTHVSARNVATLDSQRERERERERGREEEKAQKVLTFSISKYIVFSEYS